MVDAGRGRRAHGGRRERIPGHGRRGPRHFVPDARARRGRPRATGAAAGHHLVRRTGGGDRRARVQRDRAPVVPGPAAELAGELHRLEAPVGERARAGPVRVHRPVHAPRRLHRHAPDGPRHYDGVGAVGGDPLGLPRRGRLRGRACRLRPPALADPRGRADLRRPGSGDGAGGRRTGDCPRHPGRVSRRRSAEQRVLAERSRARRGRRHGRHLRRRLRRRRSGRLGQRVAGQQLPARQPPAWRAPLRRAALRERHGVAESLAQKRDGGRAVATRR